MDKTRLDIFLAQQHPHYSRTQVKKLIEDGFVTVDGEKRKPKHILKGGEDIVIARRGPEIPKAEAEEIPLDILFEDDDLLIINKAAGMVVHPAPGHFKGTLVSAVLHHLGGTIFESLPSSPTEYPRPGIVHRLDKGTSGVMIVAKSQTAQTNLMNQFKSRVVEKTYQALAFGVMGLSPGKKMLQEQGTITKAIGRDTEHRRKFSSKTRWARDAMTGWNVLKRFPNLTLLEMHPKTGRTHQIRVHLSEERHPIVGDTTYGAKSFLSSIKEDDIREKLEAVTRPLLHAWKLSFNHPRDGKRVHFEAPLADDFEEILKIL